MASEADAPTIEHLDVAASPETPTAPLRLPKLTLKPPEAPPPPALGTVFQHQTPESYAGSSRSRSESASADVDAERFANAEPDDDERDELETTPPFRMPTPPSLSSIPPAPSLMHASASSTPTPPISLPAARGRGRGRPKGSLNKRKREGGGTGRGGKAKAAEGPIMNLPAPPRAPDIPPPASNGLKIQFESFIPSHPAPPDAAEPPAKKRKTNKEKAPKLKAGTITIPAQAPQPIQFQASGSAPPFSHIPPPPQIDNIPPPPVHRYVEPRPQHTGPPRLPHPPQPPMSTQPPVAPTPLIAKQPKQPKQPKAAKAPPVAEPIPMSPPQAPSPVPTSPSLTAAPLPVPGEGGPSATELLEGVPIPRYPLPTRPFAVKPPAKFSPQTWASNAPLDRTKLPTRRWRPVQREIRGIAGGRWFAKSWAGAERSPLKGEGMGLGFVVEPPVGSTQPAIPLPTPHSLGSLPPFEGPSGSVTPAGFSLPPTPGVSGMPTGLAALAAAGAAAQHLAVPHGNGDMAVDE